LVLIQGDDTIGRSVLLNSGYFCAISTPLQKRLLFNALYATTLDTSTQTKVTRLVDVQRGTPAGRELKILVGEDNPTNQKVLTKILEYAGHRVTVVDSGERVLDMLEKADYDLIVIDMHMPEMDGIDVLKVLRYERSRSDSVPILVLTADATPEAANLCREAGADAFLTKPVESSRLLQVVQSLAGHGEETARSARTHAVEGAPARTAPLLDRKLLGELASLSSDVDFMHDLIEGFVEDTRGLIEKARQAVAAERYSEIHDCMHALKGSALSIGAIALADEVKQLQQHCQPLETRALARRLEELASCFARTETELRNYLNQLKSAVV
ncbi:MAG: Hpt domain-containing response regulator, partial [Gammaproteobacteria bacterium]